MLALAAVLLPSFQEPRVLGSSFRFEAHGAVSVRSQGAVTRFEVAGPAADVPYALSATSPLDGSIAAGHTVLFTARMRSATRLRVAATVESADPPNPKAFVQVQRLAPSWQEFRFAGVVRRTLTHPQLALWLGYGPGTVELADVRVQDLGNKPVSELSLNQDPYGGEPNPDDWRRAALGRIERIRKGDLVVHVVDARGEPARGATVHVRQLRHAFRFGTAAPAALLAREDETGTKFRDTLARLFNTVTFENDLKWNSLADPPRPDVEQAFAWFAQNGIQARGHNLVWGSRRWLPRGLWEQTDEAVKAALEARIARAVARYKGRVYLWDVVNEAVTEHDLWDRLGYDGFVQAFELAHRADPTIHLAYNDFDLTEEASAGPGHLQRAKALIRRLIDAHSPFDTIGIQSHVQAPITPTKRVLEILDNLAGYGKRLEITEYDLSLLDDKAHGEHMRDYLIACFSHPAVDAFILWGFWEGSHWRAAEGGAMFRRDWTPRPAAVAYEDLVKRQWWTDATVRTDRRGDARLRAFYGTHEVTVRGRSQKVELTKGHDGRFRLQLSE